MVGDRALKTNHGSKIFGSFEKNLEEEFTNRDGSILPIRSELTGFTVQVQLFLWRIGADMIRFLVSAVF